ncbi:MAG: prolyl oligopeptidase family serine peptidase [Actinomycetes bacterium]
MTDDLSFPRHSARTMRFTLGAPRSFTLAPDAGRLTWLQTRSGTDRSACLWVQDLPDGDPRVVADPAVLLASGAEELTPEERARRERAREGGAGVVGYCTDAAVTRAAFALSGQLYVVDLTGESQPRRLEVPTPVADPRLDPTGQRVSFTHDGSLYVVGADAGTPAQQVAERESETVTWGLAEFVAAEEMSRYRGTWWSPSGDRLLATRVDEAPVNVWHIADPAHPESEPLTVRYPAAGTPNADVRVFVVSLDGDRTEAVWDRDAYPYLATAAWDADHGPHLLVQSRDQHDVAVLRVDESDGTTAVVRTEHDDTWLELIPGLPAWLPDGRLLRVVPDAASDTNRLYADDEPLTPAGLQVQGVLGVTPVGVVVSGTEDSTEDHVHLVTPQRSGGATVRRIDPPESRVAAAVVSDSGIVLGKGDVNNWGRSWSVSPLSAEGAGPSLAHLPGRAETPAVQPEPRFLTLGERQLQAALLLPSGHQPGTRLPVLLDPYGGPHARRVLRSRSAFGESQWWADQGFAVLVIDGRGTPARTPSWERSVAGDLATPALEDQVDGLLAAAKTEPDLDLSRVAIRGWSFGGYLAALAVLRRPDVFAAAIAGAPVTDWTLYDTHYTERYLGPDAHGADAAAYRRSSLLDDAARLERPLMVIHGLADDNVVVAHSLRLSGALLAAGRAHEVLPLTGVTHMTPQEEVAENLLLLQLDFLVRALRLDR